MNLYAETSAVLRWLLGGPDGERVRRALAGAEHVFASRLTVVEAHRALARGVALGELSEAVSGEAVAHLARASARWTLVEVLPEIAQRAAERFPAEPVRTLDALHLASALFFAPAVDEIAILSTDDRIVRNAPLLGLRLALGRA